MAAEKEAARRLNIDSGSRAIESSQLSAQQRRILEDSANKIDNPRALSTDFNGNGIHVRPADGKSHIQLGFKDGKLEATSKDGATASQREAAKLRLLSEPEFRGQLARQIESGLASKAPADAAKLAEAQQFLQYLKALDVKP